MTTVVRVFVDTSVLLRFCYPELDHHEPCQAQLRRLLRTGAELWISDQVIREFYVQATHTNTLPRPRTTEAVLNVIESMPERFTIAESSAAARAQLMGLLREYNVCGKLTHDTNILAIMLTHDIDTICSLDSDFERFADRVTIVRPQIEDARKDEGPA
ncbi:MAG: type II toxin-antitoxin system VapC family toxin [Anaerolineaceae bacterium]|nr:type II toxin-antitoxin system VapC family toxin [Anaerolineaceae bacterium]